MASSNFTFTGIENLRNIFRNFPEGAYRKPLIAAFRKAAAPVKTAMAANLPSTLKPLKKILMVKAGKGKSLTLAVGFFGRQGVYVNRRGQKWDPYMLVYWHNYGTLANRSGEHSFQNARRKPSVNWTGWIKAGLFVEKAIEQSMPQAEKIFETTLETEVTKFFEKEAAK
jgi:hypothetical protein